MLTNEKQPAMDGIGWACLLLPANTARGFRHLHAHFTKRRYKMSLDTVPKEARHLRACKLCSLVKVKKLRVFTCAILVTYTDARSIFIQRL